jgi:hypothetical protein
MVLKTLSYITGSEESQYKQIEQLVQGLKPVIENQKLEHVLKDGRIMGEIVSRVQQIQHDEQIQLNQR